METEKQGKEEMERELMSDPNSKLSDIFPDGSAKHTLRHA